MLQEASIDSAPSVGAAQFILQAFESYIQQTVRRALASQVQACAVDLLPQPEQKPPELQAGNRDLSQAGQGEGHRESGAKGKDEAGRTLITQAVDSYLRTLNRRNGRVKD